MDRTILKKAKFLYHIFYFRSLEVDWLTITPLNLVGQDFPATGEEFFPQDGVMPLYNKLSVKCHALQEKIEYK